MKTFVHLFLIACVPAALLLSGCAKKEEEAFQEDPWDPAWGPAPGGTATAAGTGVEGEEVIRDTAYLVVEKRRQGGQLVEVGKSKFDGRPKYENAPVQCMIIVEGNQTGQRSAYLLPQQDYDIVQVGHALKESTLSRWETTGEDSIPASEPAGNSSPPRLRSRTGGAAENYVY